MKIDISYKRNIAKAIIASDNSLISFFEECIKQGNEMVSRVMDEYQRFIQGAEDYNDSIPEDFTVERILDILRYEKESKSRDKIMELISRHIILDVFEDRIYNEHSLFMKYIHKPNIFNMEEAVSESIPLSMYYGDGILKFNRCPPHVYANLTRSEYTEIYGVSGEQLEMEFYGADKVIVLSTNESRMNFELIILAVSILSTLSEILVGMDFEDDISLKSFTRYAMHKSGTVFEFLLSNIASSSLWHAVNGIDKIMAYLLDKDIEHVIFASEDVKCKFIMNLYKDFNIKNPSHQKTIEQILNCDIFDSE